MAIAAVGASLWLMLASTRVEAISFAVILLVGAGFGVLYASYRARQSG